MAPVAVNIAPGLQGWRRAGITHILVDEEVACAVREAVERPAGAVARPVAAAGSAGPAGSARRVPPRPVPPAQSAASAQSAQSARPARPSQPGQPTAQGASSADTERTAPSAPADAVTPQPQPALVWPPQWEALWTTQFAASPRPLAVWTYAELGEDLRGQASPIRRKALGGLIGALSMRKGSHAFWPYSIPPDNRIEPELYLDALRRFQPGVVLLFGAQAVADLTPTFGARASLPEKPLQMTLCEGYRFLRLPELESLDALLPAHRDRLTAFVRAALS